MGLGCPGNAIESAELAIPVRPLSSGGGSQKDALAAQAVSLGIELGDVELEDVRANDTPSIGHKPHVQSPELSAPERQVLQLCTGAHDNQPPVGELLESPTLD